MPEYAIQYTLDVGELFDKLTKKEQMDLLVDKFDDQTDYDQRGMLSKIFENMSFSDTAKVIMDAFDDSLSDQKQGEVYEYIKSQMED